MQLDFDDPSFMNELAKKQVNGGATGSPIDTVTNGLTEAILGFTPGLSGTQLSQSDTMFASLRTYLVSNMRQLLSQVYVEHGLISTVIDLPVDDALRGGVVIHTDQLEEDQIEELYAELERCDDLTILAEAAKWQRLFGGSGLVIVTDQDPETPLDIKKLKSGDNLEFIAADMWELFSDRQNILEVQPQQKIDPKYRLDPDQESFSYYSRKVNGTRVLKMKGRTAPSFVRPRLRGWGFSEVETVIRSINQFIKASDLTFEVLDEFKLDIFKIKNLYNNVMSKDGEAAIRKRIALAAQNKHYNNALVFDTEDDYIQKQLSFTGLSETFIGIRMAIAADLRMPLTKLFGISAAGFNSGEDDIENYNAMVEAQVRNRMKRPALEIVRLRCQQVFGMNPSDLRISFKPLRMMSSEQEENVKTQKFNRLQQARAAREISTKEFRDACNRGNLFDIKVDPDEEPLVSMDPGELVDEHERLVKTLESPSKEDDKKEAKEQKKELASYKEKAKEK